VFWVLFVRCEDVIEVDGCEAALEFGFFLVKSFKFETSTYNSCMKL